MYHDYASQSYYIKAHATQLINEAVQARQAREMNPKAEPEVVSKQKKSFFSSFGTMTSPNALVRHDI
ncbi:MAG: hypothetical protein J0I20_35610 [Chloroflexi bacterium]|nr:hypothetical protein [Chloroflexota bacterium]OJV87317.1 MAG: hypothetical protein BGO39_12205 [Chloroflexi bacterium 54-19]